MNAAAVAVSTAVCMVGAAHPVAHALHVVVHIVLPLVVAAVVAAVAAVVAAAVVVDVVVRRIVNFEEEKWWRHPAQTPALKKRNFEGSRSGWERTQTPNGGVALAYLHRSRGEAYEDFLGSGWGWLDKSFAFQCRARCVMHPLKRFWIKFLFFFQSLCSHVKTTAKHCCWQTGRGTFMRDG